MKTNTLVYVGLLCAIFFVVSWTATAGRAQPAETKVEEAKDAKVEKEYYGDGGYNHGGGGYGGGGYNHGGGGYGHGGGGYGHGGYGGGGYHHPPGAETKVEEAKDAKVEKEYYGDGGYNHGGGGYGGGGYNHGGGGYGRGGYRGGGGYHHPPGAEEAQNAAKP